ncbi:hypothetical protein CBR_g49406 [Chara braunii]|uniref:Peptidase A2 domain-containing protein n=1 Tax=Chara braunii TaxID=69332 RepID=A0A388M4Z6_CHABU|nr:hypothetical protein CBR_g49406 [Chara braunii]|eukprot:GBG89616.1 hypothetical protein CBR_g49406 [Chara braunii]
MIDPDVPGGTREEALRVAELGPNTPAMFRIWQEKEDPVVQVEDVTKLEEKMSRMGVEENKENIPLVEEDAEEEDVSINVRKTFDRMEDLVDKMQKLHLRRRGICEEVGREGIGYPKVFTMGREGPGEGPNEPNPRMLRANMTAKNSMGQRNVRGSIPYATRRPGGGNPPKEQAKTSQPTEEEPPIMVEVDEDENDKFREEEDNQAEIRAKRRKEGVKEGKSEKDETASKKRKYQTSIEEGVDLEGLVNKLLEGRYELLNLREILASTPRLREMVKARLSRKRVTTVRIEDLIPREANWSVAGGKMDWKFVGTGSIDVMIKGKMCPGMVDTGAEMNIINGETAERLGLEVDENDCGFLNGASGKTRYTGVVSNVVIEIGRVKQGEAEKEQENKGERAQREERKKGWRNYVIKMLQNDDLPVNSSWDVRFERMMLFELVVSSKHSTNMQKFMGLHEMLDEKCIRLFEEYAEVAKKLGKMEKGDDEKEIGEDLDAVEKRLQSELKESTELFNQGFLDYILRLLKEMSRLRTKEEERDAQVEKFTKDLKGVRKEVDDLRKGEEELLKQVSTSEVSLAQKSKELEDEVVEREKMEKKVEGLCSGISVQGEDLKQEISEKENMSRIRKKRWEEILIEMEELRLSHQEKGKETTRVVEWKRDERFEIKMTAEKTGDHLSKEGEKKEGKLTKVEEEGLSGKKSQEEPWIERPLATEEERSECLTLPQLGGTKRGVQPGMELSKGVRSQTEILTRPLTKKATGTSLNRVWDIVGPKGYLAVILQLTGLVVPTTSRELI